MQDGPLQTLAKSLPGRLKTFVARIVRDEAARALKHFQQNWGRRRPDGSRAPEPPTPIKAAAESAPESPAQPKTGVDPAPAPNAKPKTSTEPAPAPKAEFVDINAASVEELTSLNGIGPARAKAIVQGRPYRTTDDLVQRQVVPAAVYDGIKDRIGVA